MNRSGSRNVPKWGLLSTEKGHLKTESNPPLTILQTGRGLCTESLVQQQRFINMRSCPVGTTSHTDGEHTNARILRYTRV